ncbi:MAG: tyrosine-type recombinase/integrase [candidate division WOR-3 bacterium]
MFEEWINSYSKINTKKSFKIGISAFFKFIYGKIDLEEASKKYIEEVKKGRDYFKDLINFCNFLNNKTPKTAYTYLASIKSFLNYFLNIELTKKQNRILRSRLPKGNRARTIEGDLTREKLKKILEHCNLKAKALFLFLLSSGIRIGELLKLKLNDIDLNQDPPIVYVRGEYTKSGDPYYTFISKEAKESLIEWLKLREDYIKTSLNRSKGFEKTKNLEDDRIFPFSFSLCVKMWNRALKKAGLEEKDSFTKRRTLHIHMLRKFFISQGKLVIPETIVEALAGHTEYLDEAYRRYTKDEIREFYKKLEPNLYIFIPKEIREIQTHYQNELEETKKKVENLTMQLTSLNTTTIALLNENTNLKNQINLITQNLKELYEIINKLEEKIKKIK